MTDGDDRSVLSAAQYVRLLEHINKLEMNLSETNRIVLDLMPRMMKLEERLRSLETPPSKPREYHP